MNKITVSKGLIIFWALILASFILISPPKHDDPPQKQKLKKDTTKIDLQQMRDINKQMKIDNRLLDSLIMKIDTLKKK